MNLPAAPWPFGALRMMAYGAMLADPPWQYEMYGEGGYEKSPEAHYDTMSDDEIAALPVHLLASGDCLLFMWAIWPKLPSALRVMAAWGFTYKTGGSWTKLTRHGKRAFGTGYILRSTTEPWLIGTIGNPKIGSRSERNLIEAVRGEHSEKPVEAREKLLRLRPDCFAAELFAVDPWPGHDTWGRPHRGAHAVPRIAPPVPPASEAQPSLFLAP
ncbi:MT-A70 family methyltransferase [Aquabacter cavernae]|uniref:MT-A70 family methyltransferase n=1 Tax=Aquabacter cavernae TaxID=2496029 RepID=UPI000F8DDE26|nr:MT-A70 family methyltransferase [Aquabacter cavernae]